MKGEGITKRQRTNELSKLRQRIEMLESAETERERAEEALRESEAKYRNLVERANDGICILQDGIAHYVNPRLAEMGGETVEQITGSSFIDYIDHDEIPKVVDRYERRMRGEDVSSIYETVFRRKDGSKICVELNAGIITYQGRNADLVFVRDITERKQSEVTLRDTEEKYRSLVEFTEDSVYLVDRNRRYLFMNAKYLSRLHLTKDEAIGRAYDEFHSPEDNKEFTERVNEVFRTGRFVQYEHRSGRDGRYFLRTLSPVKENDESIEAVTVISKDITELKQTEELIQRERETFFSILHKAPYGVVLIDNKGKYLYINPEFTNITGYTLEDIPTGKDWFRKAWPDPKYRHEIIAIWKRDFARRGVDRVFSVVCKDGSVKEIEFRTTVLDDKRAILMLSDITERMRLEQQLTYMATHDILTDMPNRVLFNDRLTLALAQAHRHHHQLAVMMLDLDRFKDINDTLGHSVGDRLLQGVGDRLKSSLRKSDTVARMGGDEFLFLLQEIARAEDSLEVARKILETLQEPFLVEDRELHITASLGVVVYPEDGGDADTLMKNADIAMYSAKRQGLNTYLRYSSDMKTETIS